MIAILCFSCFFGIVPMMVYALGLWLFDRYEKEPWGLLVASFLWGFIPSAVIALIAQVILGIPTEAILGGNAFAQALVEASLIAPITEEGIKGIGVLMVFLIFRREFDSVFDGILYGGFVGFGFAAIENVLYLLNSGNLTGVLALAFLRAFLFGLNHAFFTSLTGIGLALARFQRKPALKFSLPLLGYLAAVTAHGAHNFGATVAAESTPLGLLLSFMLDSAGIFFVFVVILIALRRESQWIANYLRQEVGLGTLTERQLLIAQSARRRVSAKWGAAVTGGLKGWREAGRFYQQCAELAFKLHELDKMGDEGGNRALIERLRGEVRQSSQMMGESYVVESKM